ncbi:uncharacterized protein MYCFIDRAFT_169504 [Pseudocercospora fijiensis CIRAD86]|uniref:Uncharacterized protein n=1 Tax=Pseudocercospora fijiensis (strain CIRAD86) TaxID=383855 RepID=N1QA24_PSEFD|nr:uncharacterized protein MYCFIDRAFT_169504 [Pseudocercospora fijiensis CIRAD86]EME87742.1 hypothetical protein MYCFIDRAFT_169504 [Pseudocercospora fijiensis CIRAD86]
MFPSFLVVPAKRRSQKLAFASGAKEMHANPKKKVHVAAAAAIVRSGQFHNNKILGREGDEVVDARSKILSGRGSGRKCKVLIISARLKFERASDEITRTGSVVERLCRRAGQGSGLTDCSTASDEHAISDEKDLVGRELIDHIFRVDIPSTSSRSTDTILVRKGQFAGDLASVFMTSIGECSCPFDLFPRQSIVQTFTVPAPTPNIMVYHTDRKQVKGNKKKAPSDPESHAPPPADPTVCKTFPHIASQTPCRIARLTAAVNASFHKIDFATARRTPLARNNPDCLTSAKASRAPFSRNLCNCQLAFNSRSLTTLTGSTVGRRDRVNGSSALECSVSNRWLLYDILKVVKGHARAMGDDSGQRSCEGVRWRAASPLYIFLSLSQNRQVQASFKTHWLGQLLNASIRCETELVCRDLVDDQFVGFGTTSHHTVTGFLSLLMAECVALASSGSVPVGPCASDVMPETFINLECVFAPGCHKVVYSSLLSQWQSGTETQFVQRENTAVGLVHAAFRSNDGRWDACWLYVVIHAGSRFGRRLPGHQSDVERNDGHICQTSTRIASQIPLSTAAQEVVDPEQRTSRPRAQSGKSCTVAPPTSRARSTTMATAFGRAFRFQTKTDRRSIPVALLHTPGSRKVDLDRGALHKSAPAESLKSNPIQYAGQAMYESLRPLTLSLKPRAVTSWPGCSSPCEVHCGTAWRSWLVHVHTYVSAHRPGLARLMLIGPHNEACHFTLYSARATSEILVLNALKKLRHYLRAHPKDSFLVAR